MIGRGQMSRRESMQRSRRGRKQRSRWESRPPIHRFTKNQLRAGEGADSTSAYSVVESSPMLPLSAGVHEAAAVAAEAEAAAAAAATSLLVATAQAHGTTEASACKVWRGCSRAR
jgi:hypothetical protein